MSAPSRPPFFQRWWIYQRERFPLFAHGPLIAAFSFCAVSYSHLLRTDRPELPPWPALLVAFLTCFGFFLQLRIADEFKDFDEDSRFRPYRPVPRGLISLRELRVLFALIAVAQLAAVLLLAPRLALLLLLPWLYLAAMSKEFFVGDWLKKRPITYLWTHMLIMPLVDFYATGCDWLASGAAAPPNLAWFLAASFFNGVTIEFGRKLRAPSDEERGVSTYTALWGTVYAPLAWLFVAILTFGCASRASRPISMLVPVSLVMLPLTLVALIVTAKFVQQPRPGSGKRFELLSGLWTLGIYLSLGALPLFLR